MDKIDKIQDEELQWVASNYRENAFRYRQPRVSTHRRWWIAAAACTALLVSAASLYISLQNNDSPKPAQTEQTAPSAFTASQPAEIAEVQTLDFEDTPLPEVVDQIESAYGITIEGDTSSSRNLTLHYEGSAEDLVAAINELLNTNLSIKK